MDEKIWSYSVKITSNTNSTKYEVYRDNNTSTSVSVETLAQAYGKLKEWAEEDLGIEEDDESKPGPK